MPLPLEWQTRAGTPSSAGNWALWAPVAVLTLCVQDAQDIPGTHRNVNDNAFPGHRSPPTVTMETGH